MQIKIIVHANTAHGAAAEGGPGYRWDGGCWSADVITKRVSPGGTGGRNVITRPLKWEEGPERSA